MTGGAAAKMRGEDIGPVLDRVAVGTGLRVSLSTIGSWIDNNCVVNRPAGGPVVVAVKKCSVTGDALPTSCNCRCLQ